MPAVRIVLAVDEVEEREDGLALRRGAMVDQRLALQGGIEALATSRCRSNRRPSPWKESPRFAALSEADRCILRAVVRVRDYAIPLAPGDRHVQGSTTSLAHM